ncbi:hypothetical protein ASPVEDRAFT_32029 [Aspergillus versicolor CBS 583.65]|uniref:Siderophore biosynthesis enzyme n=1 Tax=Aspergillus versicolor CBS 583.65 TaxID=1036611 RepID=A0A1L9PW70_ASPVE|nr:uncharacterized protein ASPVEDRAFT_32029 [Aspergillus versicolor CBS 583.65]OJJ05666.1 hypothetical protein ASPVEDRAFT_32029 [Aspergillus versicolor CBS 583.65]
MKPTFFSLLPATLSLLGTAHARTDLEGCISSATTNQWHEASMIWYIEDTGEICDIPDCGGGRAPPKYNNPACPNYTGTATYEPSYLEGYGPGATATKTTARETGAESTATGTIDKNEDDDETFKVASTDHGSVTITSTPVPTGHSSGVHDGGSKGSSSANDSSSAIQGSTLASSAQELSPSPSNTPANFTESDVNAAESLGFNAGLGAVGLLAAFVL